MHKIDLHIHTSASDGEFSPEEIVDIAVKKNMDVIAITDHDTVAGISQALKYAKDKNIKIIPGVEIGCDEPKLGFSDIHVLGLFIDYKNPELNYLLDWLKEQRITQKKEIIKKLNELYYDISFEELEKEAGDSFGRPHIAKILMRKYPNFKTVQQVFDELLAFGKKAYVKQNKKGIADTIRTIKSAGGISVIAHPGIYTGKTQKVLDDFIRKGGEGIEVYYPYNKLYDFSLQLTDKLFNHLKKTAESQNLLITGGSDFHRLSRKTEIGEEGIDKSEMKKISSALQKS